MDSNIPYSPTYGVYISQLIHYARGCSKYSEFVKRHQILTNRLLNQGFLRSHLKNLFKKFFLANTKTMSKNIPFLVQK